MDVYHQCLFALSPKVMLLSALSAVLGSDCGVEKPFLSARNDQTGTRADTMAFL
jgi:hypothetical protein